MKRWIKDQEGASAVEFAIVLPLLMMVIFGTIEFGLLLYNKQVLTNAAREGCRRGVIMRNAATRTEASDNLEIRTRALDFAKDFLVTFGNDNLESSDVIINRDPAGSLAFGTDLTVEVHHSYDFLFLSTIGIGPIDLTSASTMKLE